MTTHIGDHIHTIDQPDVDLVIDVIAAQGAAPAWYSTHDRDGHRHYVSAEDTEPHGRHRDDDPTLTPATMLIAAADPLIGTITGVLR